MEYISNEVFKEFDVKVFNIKKDQFTYICKTNKGTKVLKKNFEDENNIIFQNEIKEHLKNKDFTNINKFDTSIYNAPYVRYNGSIYTMTDYYSYTKTSFSNVEDLKNIIKTMALFHKNAIDVNFSKDIMYQTTILDNYEKDLTYLKQVKKSINTKKRMSDFDIIFIKNYEFYKNQLQFSIDEIKNTNYEKLVLESKSRNFLCHNLIKEDFFSYKDDKIIITDFSCSKVDYPIVDLMSLVQRYNKNLPENHLKIYELLEVYDEYNSLNKEDIKILYLLLKYPSKFLKICNKYYTKKRTWTPNSIINKMEALIENRISYENYINETSNIFK